MQAVRQPFIDQVIAEPREFIDGFLAYSKRNYYHMSKAVEILRASTDSLDESQSFRRPYDSAVGVFPCRTFNLSQQSISYPHVDSGNLAQSWCSITPFGDFDETHGGNLVLWDFGLVIDFPAGSTVMIPSALICHSNTDISPGEIRYSMVQYAAGGLFRWINHGFMTEEAWKAKATLDDIRRDENERSNRWREAVKMFTLLRELA